MVLFHDAFVALKARCPLTVNCSPDDYILGGERQLLQAYVQLNSLSANINLLPYTDV
jgi:hypothetical protein